MSVDLESVPAEDRRPDEEFESYRAMSGVAVASLVAGILSLLAFVSWVFGLIAVLGIMLSLRARRQIRQNPRDLTGMPLANAGLAMSVVFLVGGWSLLAVTYATEVPDGYNRISYEDLQPGPTDTTGGDDPSVSLIPKSARSLDGHKVFIKGYMFPGTPQSEGIKTFVLVRDNGACCFGPSGPKLTDMILVTLKGENTASYETHVRKLAGTFKVQPQEFTPKDIKQSVGQNNVSGVLYQLEAEYLK